MTGLQAVGTWSIGERTEGSLRRGTMMSVRPARWAASGWQQLSTHRHASRPPKWPRADDLFEPCACALQRTGVDLGHVTEQRRLAGARRRRNYDDSACDSAIERIQKSAAIGFRRVPLVPQSEPSSAATTTLSAVDLSCTASLVLARAYSARTAGHVRWGAGPPLPVQWASRTSFSWISPFSSSRCASAACSMGSCRSRRIRRVPVARSAMV